MIEEPDSMNQVGRNNIVSNITIEKTMDQLIKEINEKVKDLESEFICSLSSDISSDIFVGKPGQYEQYFQSTIYYQILMNFALLAHSNKIPLNQLESKSLKKAYQLIDSIATVNSLTLDIDGVKEKVKSSA